MANEVDICNIALAHVGDAATVSSINPPEGSVQADQCAIFYPIARDMILELHTWGFAKRKAVLAQLTNDSDQWAYAYALPSDFHYAVSVLSSSSTGDYNAYYYSPEPCDPYATSCADLSIVSAGTSPQPYTIELNSSGARVLYTNQEGALLRYQAKVTDTTKLSALCVNSISWALASMLAGPIIKGEQGSVKADACMKMAGGYVAQASRHDAQQNNTPVQHIPSHIQNR